MSDTMSLSNREWKEYRLGDIANITSSRRIFYSDYVDKGIPFYRSKEIIEKANKEKVTTELFISEEKFYEIRTKYGAPSDGDILIAAVGERAGIPYCIKDDGDFYFKDGNLIWFRNFINIISSDFLVHYFNSYIGKQALESTMIGSAQKALTIIGLKGLEVSFPPLPEQKAIAGVLSSLDDKIDLLHRQNKTLEAMAETLFRQWFVEEADVSWEVRKLGDLISVKGGTTPSTKVVEYWNGNINWTSPRDLSNSNSIFLFRTERKISESGLKQIGSGLLPIGTVLLSSRAPIGYLVITEIPVAINQGYIAIVCDKLVSNIFIYLWIKANLETIINASNGSVFLEISKSTFKELEIAFPPTTKLKLFDEKIELVFHKIKTNANQIRTLEKLRDTLLPKLMSGEVRVKLN